MTGHNFHSRVGTGPRSSRWSGPRARRSAHVGLGVEVADQITKMLAAHGVSARTRIRGRLRNLVDSPDVEVLGTSTAAVARRPGQPLQLTQPTRMLYSHRKLSGRGSRSGTRLVYDRGRLMPEGMSIAEVGSRRLTTLLQLME